MTIKNELYRQAMRDLHSCMSAADEAFERDDRDELAHVLSELLGFAKRTRDALTSEQA